MGRNTGVSEQGQTLSEHSNDGGIDRAATPATHAALEAQVLEEVAASLREIIGENYVFDLEITPGARFYEDLEMESIEFVDLAGRIRKRYGDQVDFVSFLASCRPEEIRVGDVVSYIVNSLAAGNADRAADQVTAHG
jgi:acyl carrier protein